MKRSRLLADSKKCQERLKLSKRAASERDAVSKQHLSTDRTIVGWSTKLEAVGRKALAARFETDIINDFHLVSALGLPSYEAYFIPCCEFMKRVSWFERHFIHAHYYLNLLPTKPGLRKLSLVGFDKLREARDFISLHLKGCYTKYMLRLSEFEANIYGGSIMSNSGAVVVELSKGLQQKVAYGAVPVVGLVLNSYVKWGKYSTVDPTERELLWKAAQAIAIHGNGGASLPNTTLDVHECAGYWFLKGYFEFAYTSAGESSPLRLVFFDVKLGQEYYNINADTP